MDNQEAISIYEGECPGCGIDFIKKRSNQVFCTSRCKNQYHNGNSRVGRLATKERHEITKKVDDILWKNREVLLRCKKEVSVEELRKKGFQRTFISHFEVDNTVKNHERNIFYVYDVSYKFIDFNTIKILKNGK